MKLKGSLEKWDYIVVICAHNKSNNIIPHVRFSLKGAKMTFISLSQTLSQDLNKKSVS